MFVPENNQLLIYDIDRTRKIKLLFMKFTTSGTVNVLLFKSFSNSSTAFVSFNGK